MRSKKLKTFQELEFDNIMLKEDHIKMKYTSMVNLTKDNSNELESFNKQLRNDILSLVNLLTVHHITYDDFKSRITLLIGYGIISNDVLKHKEDGQETE